MNFMSSSPLFLNVGGALFVNPMRDRKCMTMLDPFHQKYGKAITTVLSLVSLFLDVIWIPTTLAGLGTVKQPDFLSLFNMCSILCRQAKMHVVKHVSYHCLLDTHAHTQTQNEMDIILEDDMRAESMCLQEES